MGKALIKISIKAKFTVYAIPGEDTEQGRQRLHKINKDSDLYVVIYGVNDAGKHHEISKEQYAANMIYFADYFGREKTLLVTPLCFNDNVGITKRTNRLAKLFSNALKEKNTLEEYTVVDIFSLMSLYPNFEDFLLDDGLHLNEKGYSLLSSLIVSVYVHKYILMI